MQDTDDQVRFSIEVTEAGEVLAVPGPGWQPTEAHRRELASATGAVIECVCPGDTLGVRAITDSP